MKRILIPALAGSLLATVSLLAAAPAGAAAAPVPTAPVAQGVPAQAVDITVTPDGFDAPPTLRAGSATLSVRSTDPSGAWLGLVRLRPGVTLDRYLDDLRRAMGNDPAEAVEGSRAVAGDVEMLGGVAVAHDPASATIPLTPGDHYLIDFRDVGLPDLASRVRPVRVVPGHTGPQVRPSARITLTDGRFDAPAALTGPVLVVNRSRQHNEAMLMPVRPGTSLADLDVFFTAVDAGRRPTGSPFTGGPTGVVPLSPGRSVTLSAELPPGNYALVTWVRDLRTGRMFAAQGMRALIRVEE
ncbi:hypothetical protein M8Z33_03600 [Streptomyces sp. ZAF1911]|uniref:hypothetical protein n=1 Tax=Streptomyces sp. ZAF1911 TaxID=2944129 RepID=UPI00237B548C|nr:hypothetical protein [Streptomyces sp. ZAF1911]MDD9375772.1 hypothetical protein [Streptomyces sp. ZAF1911]